MYQCFFRRHFLKLILLSREILSFAPHLKSRGIQRCTSPSQKEATSLTLQFTSSPFFNYFLLSSEARLSHNTVLSFFMESIPSHSQLCPICLYSSCACLRGWITTDTHMLSLGRWERALLRQWEGYSSAFLSALGMALAWFTSVLVYF